MTASSKGLSDFVEEATEVLEAILRDLLELERKRGKPLDPDLLNRIFRSAHSLKGLAAMFGEERIAQLSHHAEDVLDRLRLGKLGLSVEVLEALTEAMEACQQLLSETARGERSALASNRAAELSGRLANFPDGAPPQGDDVLDLLELDAQVRKVLTDYEEHRLRENVRHGMAVWKVRAVFDLADFDQGLSRLTTKLKHFGEVISTLPSSDPGSGSVIAFDILFGTTISGDKLKVALTDLPTSVDALLERREPSSPPAQTSTDPVPSTTEPVPSTSDPKQEASAPVVTPPRSSPDLESKPAAKVVVPDAVASPPRMPVVVPDAVASRPRLPEAAPAVPTSKPPPRPESQRPARTAIAQTVRVDIGRLDSLMDAVGELLQIKANVARLAEKTAVSSNGAPLNALGSELHRESRQLERKLSELQKGILEVRMVPLGQTFDKLERMVRRIARSAGKEVDLVIGGGEVQLDKLIVEALSDPLIHLVRNAIDHGVEAPEVREQQGKARHASLSIRAMQQGSQVVIEISDDGRGLDPDRIRQVAVDKGLLSLEQVGRLSPGELQSLIFLPGFSTAPQVSELSGRGVGLDVVKTNIAQLSGTIETRSESGRGTSFTITLPETLAVIRALVISVSGRTYALPASAVSEIGSVEESDVRTIEQREVIRLGGRTIPFARLSRLLRLPVEPRDRHFMLVVGRAHRRLAIAVDELLGQQDVVIKALQGKLRRIPGIAAATELGDRTPVLILDIGAIAEEALNPERRAEVL